MVSILGTVCDFIGFIWYFTGLLFGFFLIAKSVALLKCEQPIFLGMLILFDLYCAVEVGCFALGILWQLGVLCDIS